MAHGKDEIEGSDEIKNEAAKLLQQFSGTPRFGKRRLHLHVSLTERPPKRKKIFLEQKNLKEGSNAEIHIH